MQTVAERNQAIYEARMKRRLEEHRQALQDWRTNLRIVPFALRGAGNQLEGKLGRELAG